MAAFSERHERDTVCYAALRLRAVGFDAVKHLLLCRIERRPPKLDLTSYPYLPRANVEATSAASYMALTTEAAE